MNGPVVTLPTSVLSEPGARERGFSLVEQIVAVTIIGLLVPLLALLVAGLVRLASVSDAEVSMLAVARSQIENVSASHTSRSRPHIAQYPLSLLATLYRRR